MATETPTPTPSLTPMAYVMNPRRRRVGLLVNDYQAAARARDGATQSRLASQIRTELDLYLAEDLEHERNPSWSASTIRAVVAMALDGPDTALPHDLQALQASSADYERGIACHNLSDTLRLLGEYDDAIAYASEAVTLDPENLSRWSNLALALLFAGQIDEAEKIIDTMLQRPDFDDSTNLFRLHGKYEDAYGRFSHVPAVARLRQRIVEDK